jgi:phage gp29-like protein
MLDAVGKGVSFTEIDWKKTVSKWMVNDLVWRQPRFFTYDRVTRSVPLLKGIGGQLSLLTPFKFIFLTIKAKSGIPIRGGIARAVAWSYIFKNFGLKDWVQFAESFGQPLRIGKFAPGATDNEKRTLLRAVAAMGSDFGAIIPTNMAMEFIEAGGKAASADLYEKMVRYLDEQVSKAVLGQTGTTDATPGKLGGQNDHTKVREDIERADAVALSAAITLQLVRPYIDFNLGPPADGKYPWLKIGRVEEQDVELMLQVIEALVPLGAKVPARALLDAVGIKAPEDGEEVLVPSASGGAGPSIPFLPSPTNALALNSRRGRFALATHRRELLARMTTMHDGLAAGADLATAGWEEDMGPIYDQLVKIAALSTDYDDFQRRLTELWPDLNTAAIQDRAARFCFQAQLAGMAGDTVQPGRS